MGKGVSRRTRLALAGCSLLWFWGCASVPRARSRTSLGQPHGAHMAPLPGPVRTVVIDAGHGGHDDGTSHYSLKEKFLALDIAKRLRAHLEETGLSVVMTRETDQFVPLSDRPAIANRLGADLFVSVHINANHNRRVSGVEVYYPRVSDVASDAPWPPDVEPSEVGIPSTTVKDTLWDLLLGRTRSESRQLASHICRSVRSDLQVSCRVAKPARFIVLREAWMPAVLVEVGYVSNQEEAQRLSSAEYREAAAEAISDGIVSYIRDMGAQHI